MLLQGTSAFSGVSVVGTNSGNRRPAAAYSFSKNGLIANFTDLSSDADGGVTSRSWSFGDGASSGSANPSHAFPQAGAYTVQLTASDGSGASNCVIKQVGVNPNSVALTKAVPVTTCPRMPAGSCPSPSPCPRAASNLHFNTSGGQRRRRPCTSSSARPRR
jgi:PKD repeat protein